MKKFLICLWRYAGVIAVWLVVLQQRAFGESEPLTYASMSLPPFIWSLSLLLLAAILFIGKYKVPAMAHIATAVLSFPFLWCPSFGSSSKETANLRLMTFNVEKFRQFKPEQVAAVIRKANPDIACLQEVAPLDAPRLIPQSFHKALPGYRVIQRGETAIVTKHPVTFGSAFALRGGEGGRPAQLLTVMVGKLPVSVLCIHLQHFPWDGSSSVFKASKNLMKEIDSLEDIVREPILPTVVAGDFNTLPQGRAHRMMRKHLVDCFATSASGFGFTIPASFPMRRLDYIYVSKDIKPVRSWVASSIASDHRAVVAEVRL